MFKTQTSNDFLIDSRNENSILCHPRKKLLGKITHGKACIMSGNTVKAKIIRSASPQHEWYCTVLLTLASPSRTHVRTPGGHSAVRISAAPVAHAYPECGERTYVNTSQEIKGKITKVRTCYKLFTV